MSESISYEQLQHQFKVWFEATDFMAPGVSEELELWLAKLDELDPNPTPVSYTAEESLRDFTALYGPLFLSNEAQDPRIQAWRKTVPEDTLEWTRSHWDELKAIMMKIFW